MTLGVRVSDLYGVAKIQIEVEELTKENILAAFKSKYREVLQQIDGTLGGYVVVYDPTLTSYFGKEIARGFITYFGLAGGYRLELDMK